MKKVRKNVEKMKIYHKKDSHDSLLIWRKKKWKKKIDLVSCWNT